MQFRRGLAAPLKRYNNFEDSFKTCLKMMLQTLRSRGFGRGLHVSLWHRIGADFYRAMVATAPWGKLLIGRHPMRNWTRRTMSSLFLCRKLHLFLGKSTKTAGTRAALFDFNMHQIVCRLGLRPTDHWGAYSAPRTVTP